MEVLEARPSASGIRYGAIPVPWHPGIIDAVISSQVPATEQSDAILSDVYEVATLPWQVAVPTNLYAIFACRNFASNQDFSSAHEYTQTAVCACCQSDVRSWLHKALTVTRFPYGLCLFYQSIDAN